MEEPVYRLSDKDTYDPCFSRYNLIETFKAYLSPSEFDNAVLVVTGRCNANLPQCMLDWVVNYDCYGNSETACVIAAYMKLATDKVIAEYDRDRNPSKIEQIENAVTARTNVRKGRVQKILYELFYAWKDGTLAHDVIVFPLTGKKNADDTKPSSEFGIMGWVMVAAIGIVAMNFLPIGRR